VKLAFEKAEFDLEAGKAPFLKKIAPFHSKDLPLAVGIGQVGHTKLVADSNTGYRTLSLVMPAKAGTQGWPSTALAALGPRFRGGDERRSEHRPFG
jgi:hypothetical protein